MRIFLADDHEAIRNGIKVLLEDRPDLEVVGEAEDGNTILAKLKETNPDVVLMDISMPGPNGFVLTEEIKQRFPDMMIVFLTAHEESAYIHKFANSNANGYVLKRSAAEEIINSLEALKRKETYVDPALAGEVLQQIRQRKELSEQESVLNEHEKRILAMVAQGRANKEIAKTLNLSVRTIESYKARAMNKLGFKGRNEIVKFAYNQGWLLEEKQPI